MRNLAKWALTVFACTTLAPSSSHAQSSANWENFRAYFEKCGNVKQRGEACVAEIEKLLAGNDVWGDTNSNFEEGRSQWPGTKLEIVFGSSRGEEGDFEVRKAGDKLQPRIALARSADAFELLITINHEIVHFANSKRLKELFSTEKKIDGCLTPYRLTLLENERRAYLSEIYFWKTAPLWFKNEQKRTHFNSRLLGKGKVLYAQYYKLLEDALDANPNFIARRYIELGLYPKCALKLLDDRGGPSAKPDSAPELPPGHPPYPI